MVKRLALLVLVLVSCSGCTLFCNSIDTKPPLYPHHSCYGDVEMTWQAERTAGGIRILGIIRDMRTYSLQNLKLTARLINERERVIGRGTWISFPDIVAPGSGHPFQLEFDVPAETTVSRIDFSYVYQVSNGGTPFSVYAEIPPYTIFASPL